MRKIVLAGKDWQARALLRAQLLEEGLAVEAHESADSALRAIEGSETQPSLILADLSASDDPSGEIELLTCWVARVPTWVIASRHLAANQSLENRGFELVLIRPVDVGGLVEKIKQRLG